MTKTSDDHDLLIRISEKLDMLVEGQNSMRLRIKWLERIVYVTLGVGATTGAGVGIVKAALGG